MGIEKKSQEKQMFLSKIARGDGHGENSPYFDGWKAYENDPFHITNNPLGVIQMGLAENQLSFDLVKDWILENPEASICTAQGVHEFKDIAIFQDYHGLPEFREGVAKFMERVRGNRVRFDPDRIVMSGGATGAHEMIAFCLADPGEAFLVPVPYYPGFDRDLRWRTGIKLFPVACHSSNGFKPSQQSLQEALNKAEQQNIKVKGILITNPSNPLGTILDRDTLRSILVFANDNNIHLVCDEIYAATVFNSDSFVSIAEIMSEDQDGSHYNRNLVHIVYSLSKDLGFPGFRVGIVYSYNDEVVHVARKMSSFGLVSTHTQHLVASMLNDDFFVANFLAESSRRLAARHKKFTRGLAHVGITCLESEAGLFVWMDLRRLLKEKNFESEMDLWRVIIEEVKLNVSPGVSFHCMEAGWFRVCIANMDEETMNVALRRIRNFVVNNSNIGNSNVKNKKKCWQDFGDLRLSFNGMRGGRFVDEFAMSPHSPMPHSPLVHART